MISLGFITTYPAVESDSVTFIIQKLIKSGIGKREDIYEYFNYDLQIGNRLKQLHANNFIKIVDDKIILLNKGKRLAYLFLIMNFIYNKDKGG